MRVLVSTFMTICLVALPTQRGSAEPRVALRGEGYLGYSTLELESLEEDAFQGGGAGSASVVLDRWYLQGDVFGDYMDFDLADSEIVGVGGHAGWRDAERGSAGWVGTYNYQDTGDLDLWRTGFEGELFLDRVTVMANAGYSEGDGEGAAYLDAGLSFYPIDRARIQAHAGGYALEEDDRFVLVGAGGELLVANPVAAFVRWDAMIFDGPFDLDQHSIVAGMRLYWGAEEATLRSYDRSHFKDTCLGILLAGRFC